MLKPDSCGAHPIRIVRSHSSKDRDNFFHDPPNSLPELCSDPHHQQWLQSSSQGPSGVVLNASLLNQEIDVRFCLFLFFYCRLQQE